jgi:hypothetical protein
MGRKGIIYEELSIDDKIKLAIAELMTPFASVDEGTMKVVRPLIQNAGFMKVQLEKLQKDINEKGVLERYQNGENQWGTKKNPEIEIYLTMSKNFAQIVKQMFEMIPDAEKTEAGEALLGFLQQNAK